MHHRATLTIMTTSPMTPTGHRLTPGRFPPAPDHHVHWSHTKTL